MVTYAGPYLDWESLLMKYLLGTAGAMVLGLS